VRRLAVDGAANALRGAENLLDCPAELLCERLVPHGACNVNDGVELNVARVLDVLLLFAVPRCLLERADDERRCGGDDGYGSLSVLDRELHGDAQTLPVASGFGDVLSDDLGRKTDCGRGERTT
jgi:hypothetical protein